jgi:hypothetical protein
MAWNGARVRPLCVAFSFAALIDMSGRPIRFDIAKVLVLLPGTAVQPDWNAAMIINAAAYIVRLE